MNKIFLTGGSSMLGKTLVDNSPCEIYAPTRNELDLSNSEVIKNIDFSDFDTLIILHRAGHGERYYFTDWPVENLEYNLNVNVTNTMLLIQKWFQHTTTGTVFFMGTSDVNEKCDYKVPYWAAKEMIINTLHSLKKTHQDCRVHTLNPAKFEAKNKKYVSGGDIRSVDELANIIWHMIKNNIAHIDLWNQKNTQSPPPGF